MAVRELMKVRTVTFVQNLSRHCINMLGCWKKLSLQVRIGLAVSGTSKMSELRTLLAMCIWEQKLEFIWTFDSY